VELAEETYLDDITTEDEEEFAESDDGRD